MIKGKTRGWLEANADLGQNTEKRDGGRDTLGVWDYQIQITIHKIEKQQGFTI